MVQFGLHAGSGVWLDGLVVECILLNLGADDLARVCLACKALSEPAQAAAKSLLHELLQQAGPGSRHLTGGARGGTARRGG